MTDAQPIASLLRDTTGDASLRTWRIDDAPALLAAWTDPDVARWNGVPPEPSIQLATKWLTGASRQTTASPSIDIVLVDDNDQVLGEVGFVIDRQRQVAEVGFWVGAAHRRHGVGSRLLAAARQLAPPLELERAFAISEAENEAAIALLGACGWPEVATTTSKRRAFLLPIPSPT